MFRKKIIGITNVDRASQVFRLFEAHTRIGQMREFPTILLPPGQGSTFVEIYVGNGIQSYLRL